LEEYTVPNVWRHPHETSKKWSPAPISVLVQN
jgi:hypothetical protein